MNLEIAEVLALKALSHVVADDEARRTLLTQTGLTADEMRAAAGTRDFQAGVLEFLTRHESILIAFCESEGYDPAEPAKALRALSGGSCEGHA